MRDGEQDPKRPGLIYSEAAGKFVSRASYNATRANRVPEFNIVQERALRLRDKITDSEDGPLDYFTLHRDLLTFIYRYCTDQDVLNLVEVSDKILSDHLEKLCQSRPDVYGLSSREDRQKDLVRYWIVRDLNERGYTTSRPGMNNKVARAYALAIMQDKQMPAGSGRDGGALTDEALKAAVKRVAARGDDATILELKPHSDADSLPAWAITKSERIGIPNLTPDYLAELQRKFPHLPRIN